MLSAKLSHEISQAISASPVAKAPLYQRFNSLLLAGRASKQRKHPSQIGFRYQAANWQR